MAVQKTILTVEGMSCNHCKAAVEKALKKIEGVEEVNVDLVGKKVSVIHTPEITTEKLAEAIEKAGYRVNS
ncbi:MULTISPECIES: heavy-metal-associated domain-containing protein [Desulfofundulus]|uniref:Copper chaperone CopZ n=1 Tax=Desulfofundulus australicus DSM 11792 TaxID=1121425 RepID=A0A1M5C6M0_9FIRM|nr:MULTISPECIES: copper ion binding protein [Desulfofundulus]MCS5695864.1 copper ion binding protein [Desulfofundulus thermocisternus]SHF50351.1 copper chaperone [Desulfofundulus australicus DSM 11792]